MFTDHGSVHLKGMELTASSPLAANSGATNGALPPDRPALLTTVEAAAHLSVAPSTLAHWRSRGEPHPPAVRLGRRTLRYRVTDLDAWLEAQVEQAAA